MHGSDNYVYFQFYIFYFLIMLLVEYFHLNKINYNLIILFIATPFLFFNSLTKFFFGPFLIISLFIFYFKH